MNAIDLSQDLWRLLSLYRDMRSTERNFWAPKAKLCGSLKDSERIRTDLDYFLAHDIFTLSELDDRLERLQKRSGDLYSLIGHLNKSATQQTALRGLGSIDSSACVRRLLFIGRAKKYSNLRVMTHEKSSLAPLGTSLAFILGDEDRFRWVGESSLTADDIMTGASAYGDSKLQQAKELIRMMCSDGYEVKSSDIDRAAIEKASRPGRYGMPRNRLWIS